MAQPAARLLVTDAQCLRIPDLKQAGVFAHPGQIHHIRLPSVESPAAAAWLACFFSTERTALAVAHHVGGTRGNRKLSRYWIELDRTPGHFGGVRHWLLCPGERCNRAFRRILPGAGPDRPGRGRVAALYLPPGATQFRCRDCHGLTYRTKQLHYGNTAGKSSPSSRSRPTAQPAAVSLTPAAARGQLLGLLQELHRFLGQRTEHTMSRPELTLRQQAVWYLWGVRRVPVEEVAQLFGVTPRTICRDLAAIRARGWRRPRAKDTLPRLGLDLILEVRTRLDAAYRTAYEELPRRKKGPEREAMLAGLRQATRLESELALAASRLVDAMHREQASLPPEQLEAMRQELTAALASMLSA